jgi:hypothetical protein
MDTPNAYEHRETWLHQAMLRMRPIFAECGGKIPANIRVAPGFPAGTRRAIGQCWPEKASKDGSYEIFISPVLDDPMRVLNCLAHELIHPTVGLEAGHKGPFKRLALAIGLTGPMTATQASETFKRRMAPILESLGPYPHAELNPWKRARAPEQPDGAEEPDRARLPAGFRRQGTRLLKMMCPVDGYTVRVTAKWLKVGPPHCPHHGAMVWAPRRGAGVRES